MRKDECRVEELELPGEHLGFASQLLVSHEL